MTVVDRQAGKPSVLFLFFFFFLFFSHSIAAPSERSAFYAGSLLFTRGRAFGGWIMMEWNLSGKKRIWEWDLGRTLCDRATNHREGRRFGASPIQSFDFISIYASYLVTCVDSLWRLHAYLGFIRVGHFYLHGSIERIGRTGSCDL